MKKKGFTIVELLVVVSILLLVFFIVVPILMNSPSRREKQEAIKEGQPIIEAIYKYKDDKGIWPQHTEDFVPEYLETMPSNLWHYREGWLCRKFDSTRDYIGYNFIDEQWKKGGDSYSGTMDVKQAKPTPQQLPEE